MGRRNPFNTVARLATMGITGTALLLANSSAIEISEKDPQATITVALDSGLQPSRNIDIRDQSAREKVPAANTSNTMNPKGSSPVNRTKQSDTHSAKRDGSKPYIPDENILDAPIFNPPYALPLDRNMILPFESKSGPTKSEAMKWINEMQEKYGVYAPAETTWLITNDMGGCRVLAAGCATMMRTEVFGIPIGRSFPEIRIRPSAIYDVHLLFHEIGHSKGIHDECEADRYSRSIHGKDTWSYPECAYR